MGKKTMQRCGAIAIGIALWPAAALAGGCGAAECYERVRTPDVYQTVARPVVIASARHVVVSSPAVIGHQVNRVELTPGSWHAHHQPALYGSRVRQVQVAPARVHYASTAPVYRTEHQTVVVAPGGYRWEHRRDRFGHDRLCKVHTAPVTRTVARQVLVAPAGRVAHVTPAAYRFVEQPVLLQAARTRHTYQPGVHDFVSHHVVVRPATQHVVTHPAVIGVAHERVLVERGGHAWRPAHGWFR